MVVVCLPDGSLVRSWQSHRQNFLPGTAVSASVRPDHPLSYFVNGKAV